MPNRYASIEREATVPTTEIARTTPDATSSIADFAIRSKLSNKPNLDLLVALMQQKQ